MQQTYSAFFIVFIFYGVKEFYHAKEKFHR